MSKTLSLVRYGVVLAALCVVAIGLRGLQPSSLIGVIVFALICLKYPLFDSLIRMMRERRPKLKVVPWLWVGYALAASVHVAATWIALRDDSGASFALLAAVLISPCFLAGAIACMALHTLLARKR